MVEVVKIMATSFQRPHTHTATLIIKKKWQEYTERYKKDLHNPDNHDTVLTNLEPDILECEVKWALGSITMNKASGGDGFQLSYFKS